MHPPAAILPFNRQASRIPNGITIIRIDVTRGRRIGFLLLWLGMPERRNQTVEASAAEPSISGEPSAASSLQEQHFTSSGWHLILGMIISNFAVS